MMALLGRCDVLCILMACFVVSTAAFVMDSNYDTGQSVNLKSEIEKRGLTVYEKAIKQLLSGLRKSTKSFDGYTVYYKTGDFKTAETDFFNLKPKNIRQPTRGFYLTKGNVFFGQLGRRTIRLVENGTQGKRPNPVLEIIGDSLKGSRTDRIIYRESKSMDYY